MLVFNFLQTRWAIDNLEKERLKISRFADLNDPYEVMGVDIRNRERREIFKNERRRQDARLGLICFSETWANPLMWSHYAEKHFGVCLGFEVPEDKLVSIRYRRSPMHAALAATGGVDELLVSELLRTKYLGWKYEREKRLFIQLNDALAEGSMHFYPFSDDLRLRSVVLGHRCELDVPKARLLASKFPGATVVRARLAFGKFRVIEKYVGAAAYD